MSRTIIKAKTSKVNRAAASAPSSDASPTVAIWTTGRARGWDWKNDLPPGEELVACLRPFIEHLASSILSPKTIRQREDNLWMLGGEIIRDLNYAPALRKAAPQRFFRDAVHADGGPLLRCRTACCPHS